MFNLEMLPADYGDCILVEYGTEKNPSRILIDTGTAGTFPALKTRIDGMKNGRDFELLVLTHVDDDHIGGALTLLRRLDKLGVGFKDIWFNGFRHLQNGLLGGPQGEELSTILEGRGLPWNKAFSGKAVAVPEKGDLPTFSLNGGMQLVLLSPRKRDLLNLIPKWEEECRKAGLIPGGGVELEPEQGDDDGLLGDEIDVDSLAKKKSKADDSESNASSIALLLERGKTSVVLSGDSHSNILIEGLERVKKFEKADVFKLPHHGSQGNVTMELLKAVGASKYLVSSSGARFRHPSREAIARVLKCEGKKDIYFNYKSPINSVWEDLAPEYDCQTHFEKNGKTVKLED